MRYFKGRHSCSPFSSKLFINKVISYDIVYNYTISENCVSAYCTWQFNKNHPYPYWEGPLYMFPQCCFSLVQSDIRNFKQKYFISTKMGFEPTRAEPNGLAVHRLNHSATSSEFQFV